MSEKILGPRQTTRDDFCYFVFLNQDELKKGVIA